MDFVIGLFDVLFEACICQRALQSLRSRESQLDEKGNIFPKVIIENQVVTLGSFRITPQDARNISVSIVILRRFILP